VIATLWKKGWWVDPVGGILISAAIIWRWVLVTLEQVQRSTAVAIPPFDAERLLGTPCRDICLHGFDEHMHPSSSCAM